MHVRMPLGEGCDKEQLVAPYPPHTASPLFQRGLRFGPAFRGRGDVAHDSSLWERQVMHGRDCFPHHLNAFMSRTTRASVGTSGNAANGKGELALIATDRL